MNQTFNIKLNLAYKCKQKQTPKILQLDVNKRKYRKLTKSLINKNDGNSKK
jgi:hypothetical protein